MKIKLSFKRKQLLRKVRRLGKRKIYLITLSLIFLLYFSARYKAVFVTIIFATLCGIIKFKRQMLHIPINIEPLILCSIILTQTYGLGYGMFIVLVPNILAEILSGSITGGTLVNIMNKTIINLVVYFFAVPSSIILITMIAVIGTDIIGFPLGLTLGQPVNDVVTGSATNAVVRFAYLNLFLGHICNILGSAYC